MHHFFNKIMSSTAGRAVKLFRVWKSMPERKNDEAIKRANGFERRLEHFL